MPKRIAVVTFEDDWHEHVRVDWQAKTEGGLNLTPVTMKVLPPVRPTQIDPLLTDLEHVTTRMMVYGSRSEREAAQRLRDAAGLKRHITKLERKGT